MAVNVPVGMCLSGYYHFLYDFLATISPVCVKLPGMLAGNPHGIVPRIPNAFCELLSRQSSNVPQPLDVSRLRQHSGKCAQIYSLLSSNVFGPKCFNEVLNSCCCRGLGLCWHGLCCIGAFRRRTG